MNDSERYDVPAVELERLRSICQALPETYEEPAWVGVRWRVRQHTIAHLLRIQGGRPISHAKAADTSGPALVLTFRPAPDEEEALGQMGPPYFLVRWGRPVGGVVLGVDTDWNEVRELLTDSYLHCAPKFLTARLSGH